jgi:hypothetical protein
MSRLEHFDSRDVVGAHNGGWAVLHGKNMFGDELFAGELVVAFVIMSRMLSSVVGESGNEKALVRE